MKRNTRLAIGGLALALLGASAFAVLRLPAVQMKWMEQADLGTLQGWIADNPNDWRTQYWYGKRAAEAGDFVHAEPALRAAFGTAQDFLPAGTELGKLLLATGRTEEAFQVLRMIVGRDAGQTDAQLALAQLYRSQGAGHRSIEIVTQVLKRSPKDKLALYELGAANESIGRLADAEKPLGECLAVDPRFVPALILMSGVARRQGNLDQAVRLAREAVKWGAGQPGAHLELARALGASQPIKENRAAAVADLKAFMPLAPNHPGLRLELGQLLLKQGDFQGAGEQFQEVVRLLPGESAGYFYLAQALGGLGRREEERRVRSVFVRLQAYERAIMDLGSKIGADIDNVSLRYRLGELHASHGRLDRAIQAYRLGLQRDRDNEKARRRLVELMQKAREGASSGASPTGPAAP